jgi:DNA-binding CsgD family transcriptional regulator
VRERVSPSAWRALHRRVAAIVQHPEQRALHLSEAATGPDEPTAAALDEAARHAAHRGAPASAADLYERAARLTPADAGEARLQRELAAADAHARSGDAARVEALLRPVAEHVPRGPARARVLYRLAFACGDATVLDLALQALDEADETDNRLLSDIQLLLAGIMYAREGVTAALPHAQAAAAHGERADDPALRSRAYVRIASLQYALGNGVQHALLTDAAALEAAGGPAAGFVTAAIERAAQLGERGHIDQAREILVRELARARADANAEHEWVAYGSLVEVEIRAGRLDLAAAYAAQCRELGEAFAMHNCVAIAYALDAYVEAHRGAEADARARADEALRAADEISDELTGALARHALGLLELSLGNGEPAVEHLTRVCDVTTRLRVIEPGQRAFVPDLAEALVLAGDPGRAATVQAAFEHDARALAHATATAAATRARGLIAGAAGNHGDAVAAHREALALLEHAKHPFEHARTLLALGSEHRRAKERAAARRTLDNARAAFAAMGATLWTERAQSELDRIGGRRARDRDELTATEERVARLAAEGQRNREIAATLFITERTVEANLTRAYRKLGVRSRTELARQLSAE